MSQDPGDDPEHLREEIAQTRQQLGDTVEALSAKADVKGQVSQKIDERKTALKQKLSGARARGAGATPEEARRAASQVARRAEERPFPAIAGAFVAGLVIGRLLGRR